MRSGLIKRKRTDTLDASDPDFSSATFTLQFEPPSAMSKKASLFKLGGLTTDGFISQIDESATDNDLASLALGLLLKQSPDQQTEGDSRMNNQKIVLQPILAEPEIEAIKIEDQQNSQESHRSSTPSSGIHSDHGRKSKYAKILNGRKSPPMEELRKKNAFENDPANEDFLGLLSEPPKNLKSRIS